MSKLLLTAATFFLLPNMAAAAVYFVDATSGNDANSGLSPESAWKTISKVNSIDFDDGDIVRLKRGEVWGQTLRLSATIDGDGVNGITVEDYGTGEMPFLNGNVAQPINIDSESSPGKIASLTLRNMDISGQDWAVAKVAHVSIRYVQNVTIEGLFGDGLRGATNSLQEGKNAISIYRPTGQITIKNNRLHNWGPIDLPASGSDAIGIALLFLENGSYDIQGNTIHSVNADCIQLYETTAPGRVRENVLYNAGENVIDVKGTSNAEIYDNTFYREEGFGLGGSGSEGALIVVHGRGLPANNNVIRQNEFRDCGYYGISVSYGDAGLDGLKVSGNRFEDCKNSIRVLDQCIGVEISGNIFASAADGYAILENNSALGTKIVNNTIYEGAIEIRCGNQTEVKNNIAYLTSDSYGFSYSDCGTDPIVSNNLWFNPLHSKRTKWKSTDYGVSNHSSWVRDHAGDRFLDDPLWLNPASRDFALKLNSPAVDSGIDVGLTTDLKGTSIPQGDAPDIGALEWTIGGGGSSISPPRLSIKTLVP